jgi:hypothetical protein
MAVDAGCEIAHLARPVVVDGAALDDSKDRIAVAIRVGETAQCDHTGTAREHGARRALVERATHAIGREDLALVVAVAACVRHFDGDATGDGHVGLERQQALHREVDRDERGGARRLHVDRRTAEVESIRHTGREEVLVVCRVAQQEPADLVDELGVRQQVVDEVRVHAAPGEHADGTLEALGHVPGRLDCFPGDLVEVPVLGIHDGRVPLANAEERRVEVLDALQYTGALDVVARLDQRRGEACCEQCDGIQVDEAIVAVAHARPQRVGIGRAREPARHANDGYVGFGQFVSIHAVRVLG